MPHYLLYRHLDPHWVEAAQRWHVIHDKYLDDVRIPPGHEDTLHARVFGVLQNLGWLGEEIKLGDIEVEELTGWYLITVHANYDGKPLFRLEEIDDGTP